MSTILSHAVVPVAIGAWFSPETVSADVLTLGILCSMVPDLDVIGFAFSVRYGSPFGHRGFTHSLGFAVGLGALITVLWPDQDAQRPLIFLFLCLSTLSHPLLDALTDGGLGVALLWPFRNERYFFRWRPIAVPPIGLQAFFTARGWQVFKSELRWIWLPGTLLFGLGKLARLFL